MTKCSCGYIAIDDEAFARHLIGVGAYEYRAGSFRAAPNKLHGEVAVSAPPEAPTKPRPPAPQGPREPGSPSPWRWAGAGLVAAMVAIWGLSHLDLGYPLGWLLWALGAGFLAWQVAHFVEGPMWVFVWLFALVLVWLIGPLRWAALAVVLAFKAAGA